MPPFLAVAYALDGAFVDLVPCGKNHCSLGRAANSAHLFRGYLARPMSFAEAGDVHLRPLYIKLSRATCRRAGHLAQVW